MKELLQRDLSQVKADVRSEEKFDFAKLHDEITELEKRVRERERKWRRSGRNTRLPPLQSPFRVVAMGRPVGEIC